MGQRSKIHLGSLGKKQLPNTWKTWASRTVLLDIQRLPCCSFISETSGHWKEVLCINDSDDMQPLPPQQRALGVFFPRWLEVHLPWKPPVTAGDLWKTWKGDFSIWQNLIKKLGGLFWLKCGAALLHQMIWKGLDSALQWTTASEALGIISWAFPGILCDPMNHSLSELLIPKD